MSASHLHCLACGADLPVVELYRCPECAGELDVRYDLEAIRRRGDFAASWRLAAPHWRRFAPLLPLGPAIEAISLGEGGTPLVRSHRLAARLGLSELWFKLEGVGPTGSFKDRQVAVALSKAAEWGRRRFATVSSGNVGVALSAYAARAGVEALVWVSGETPEAKRLQIETYGARVFLLPPPSSDGPGAYYRAFKELGGWCVRHGAVPMVSARPVNPFMVEGAKAIAWEIAAEIGTPDLIFAPAGGGGLVGGLWKGGQELVALGLADGVPALHAAQRRAYFVPLDALDDPRYASDAYYRPLDGEWARAAVGATGGSLAVLDDETIEAALAALAHEEGIFAEPHGAYAAAGLIRAAEAGAVDRDARTVCIVSGVGLKDMDAAARLVARHGAAPLAVGSLDDAPIEVHS